MNKIKPLDSQLREENVQVSKVKDFYSCMDKAFLRKYSNLFDKNWYNLKEQAICCHIPTTRTHYGLPVEDSTGVKIGSADLVRLFLDEDMAWTIVTIKDPVIFRRIVRNWVPGIDKFVLVNEKIRLIRDL